MKLVEVFIYITTVLTAINSLLIWRLMREHSSRIDRFLAAFLCTVGETKAATIVHPPEGPKGPSEPVLPTQRPQRIGLTPR